MPPGFWANAASVMDTAISNAPAAASARNFCFISVSLPLAIARGRPVLLGWDLDEARGRPCSPRLIAELAFNMPTLRSVPQMEGKGQGGSPRAARRLHAPFGNRRPR